MEISDVITDLRSIKNLQNSERDTVPYQGREFTVTLQAPTEEELDVMIHNIKCYAHEHEMNEVDVLQKGVDPDGGYRSIIVAHNWNPISWVKERFGGESSEEQTYIEAEEKAKKEELEEEKRIKEEELSREQKARIAQSQMEEQERQQKMREETSAQRAVAHEQAIGKRRETIAGVKAKISEIPTAALGKVITVAAKPFGKEYAAQKQELEQQLTGIGRKQEIAAMELQKRRATAQYQIARKMSGTEAIGADAASLTSGFMGEYRKIAKLARAGRARSEDTAALRELITEARMHSVDEDLLKEITTLRRRIEGQSIARKVAGAVESVPRMGAGMLQVAGRMVSRPTREEIVQSPGTTEYAAGARPVRSSDILSPAGAFNIFAGPVKRTHSEQSYGKTDVTGMLQMPSHIAGVPMRGATGTKIPKMRDLV